MIYWYSSSYNLITGWGYRCMTSGGTVKFDGYSTETCMSTLLYVYYFVGVFVFWDLESWFRYKSSIPQL